MIKFRTRVRQWYIDRLCAWNARTGYKNERLQARINVQIDKQMADRAKLKINELPWGGFIFWGD